MSHADLIGCKACESGRYSAQLFDQRGYTHTCELCPVGRTVWFLGNGGMDYGDYHRGLYRDYYRDPFHHSLLSTRQRSQPLGAAVSCEPCALTALRYYFFDFFIMIQLQGINSN